MQQHDIFLEKEGDAWFARNENGRDIEIEHVLARHTKDLQGKVLSIGCADGLEISHLETAYGIDPSQAAIESGKLKHPHLHLAVGTSDALAFDDESFDVVIASFVLCWVDRNKLLKTASEIDRVLKPGGTLIINDFYPSAQNKVRYHHRQDVEMYTYKQDYATLFFASCLYTIEQRDFYHSGVPSDYTHCSLAVLKKI
jgi:ubiquinone/menaquinone biosynthesis C-methylase UbiE